MLVLTLRKHEKVFIEVNGKTVGLMITGNQGGKTCIGFSAAKDVKILREEAKVKEPKDKEKIA